MRTKKRVLKRGGRRSHRPVIHHAHHAKPYRVQHLGALALAILFLMVTMLKLGYVFGASKTPAPLPVQSQPVTSLQTLRSSYGISFVFDNSQIEVTAQTSSGQVTGPALGDGRQITSLTAKPRSIIGQGKQAAAVLELKIEPDTAKFEALRAANTGLSEGQVAALALPFTAQRDVNVQIDQSGPDVLDGVSIYKTAYSLVPRGTTTRTQTFAVVWTGVTDGHAFSLSLLGLVGDVSVPESFTSIFDSLHVSNSQKVAGAVTTIDKQKIDSRYLSDLYSPAVVKIYHVVCGELVIGGSVASEDACSGSTGSGFLVSGNGYIATNGHVVSYTAKDFFVEALLNDQVLLNQWLRIIGMNNAQISQVMSRPELLAAVIAKIYDIPDDQLKFNNKREAIFAALGDEPIRLKEQADVNRLVDFGGSDKIKKAELIAMNYKAKDVYTVESGDEHGFSSSDVALLKIDMSNTPYIPLLGGKDVISQNQAILVMGFPGDAENPLIDNSSLGVTVTSGTISSIRDAAGGNAKLYQSDADASHGNSGGPVLTEDGHALGLLTYRFQSGSAENAAKSYIRDINDFVALAKANDITFASASSTQSNWDHGVLLFSQHHFVAALDQFNKVKDNYPSHRLVDGYIAAADKAIKAGEDVPMIPLWLNIAVIGVGIGFVALSVWLIARHRANHQLYKLHQQYGVVPETGKPYPLAERPRALPHPRLGVHQPKHPAKAK